MKELQTILNESIRLKAESTKAVLATVVDVQGSSYRLPGARMLISNAGKHSARSAAAVSNRTF